MSIIICNKSSVKNIPPTIGIYIFFNKKEILYIGKSINLKARVTSHFENARIDNKERAIIEGSDKIKIIPTESEFKALILESALIQKHEPKYNRIWRDDKSYLYIKITIKDKYPKIYSVRREDDGKSIYFGPFHSVRIINNLTREIRRAFPFCTQSKIGKRPCFYSKLNLCNPCPSYIELQKPASLKKQLRKAYLFNIRQIIKIFKGQTSILLKDLYKKMAVYTKEENYEGAIQTRNKVLALENLIHERLSLDHDFLVNSNLANSQTALLKILVNFFPNLKDLNRIECYDISNIGGKLATGSMVVVKNGILDRGEYRKFRIKKETLNSDFEMISDIIKRRFNNDWERPNLVVVDGGRPQVKAIYKIMHELNIPTPVIGIAKNPDRLVIGNSDFPTIKITYGNPGFNLIRLLRDESHRFAKKYHLLLRERKLV